MSRSDRGDGTFVDATEQSTTEGQQRSSCAWKNNYEKEQFLSKKIKEAVAKNDLSELQRSLNEWDDDNKTDYTYQTLVDSALLDASVKGRADMCRCLLRAGAREIGDCHDDSYYSFHVAAEAGHIDVLRVFFEERSKEHGYGYDLVNEFDDDPYRGKDGPQRATPLLRAALDGQGESCRVLLEEFGADPDLTDPDCEYEQYSQIVRDFGPLHAAIARGDTDLVSLLLKHGATVDNGAVKLAIEEGYGNILSIFAVADNCKGCLQDVLVEAIEDAGSFPQEEQRVVVEAVVKAGIDLNFRIAGGATPLWLTMGYVNKTFAELLLAHGADPFRESEKWDAEFTTAVIRGNKTFVELFLDQWSRKFPSGKNNDGDYPLHAICQIPDTHLTATKFVLDYQPSALQVPDDELGLLPVFIASMWDLSLDVIFTLLKSYPEAVRRNQDGNPIPMIAALKSLENRDNEPGTQSRVSVNIASDDSDDDDDDSGSDKEDSRSPNHERLKTSSAPSTRDPRSGRSDSKMLRRLFGSDDEDDDSSSDETGSRPPKGEDLKASQVAPAGDPTSGGEGIRMLQHPYHNHKKRPHVLTNQVGVDKKGTTKQPRQETMRTRQAGQKPAKPSCSQDLFSDDSD